ncbi:MAG: formate dehydrogenase accessory sulfurtransferase FdhD [Methanocorpusculum sp.]|nr:formate dehydrogenase accessory sulfurtransferase FdhD [Methanocorpusculum sp.]
MLNEKPVQIIVNGRAAITLMTSEEKKTNLVVGAMLTEKVIESLDDVESIIEEDSQVSVITKNPYSILLSRKTVLAGCGGASSFLDSGKLGHISSDLSVSKEDLMKAAEAVSNTLWFSGGLFSSNGNMLKAAEDISSQNVLDVLIGFALLEKVDLGNCFVVLKGNAVTETVRKAVIANIPVLAVFGETTAPACDTAEEAGLRLIIF